MGLYDLWDYFVLSNPSEPEESGVSHSSNPLITRGHTLGGFISGSTDLFAASTFAAIRGITPKRVLQTIASAMIGPKAFGNGRSTVTLGLGLHFLIAFTVATTYIVASRYLTMLTEHSLLSGLLYGAAVHLFMTFIVLPLTSLMGVALAAIEMQQPALARAVPIAAGVVVLIAGALQFTAGRRVTSSAAGKHPGPAVCCGRTPPRLGGLRLGLHCSQCCDGLIAILLVIGVMDLHAMAVVAAAITVERLAPTAERVARATGAVIVGAGLF
jgi:hypothetical protein